MPSLHVSQLVSKLSYPLGNRHGSLDRRQPVYPRFMTAVQCSSQIGARETMRQPAPLIPMTSSIFEDDSHLKHQKNLTKVRSILTQKDDITESMVIIDSLQRMGIDYHFKEEIKVIIDSIYRNFGDIEANHEDNLLEVSLGFRLLRQAGYHILPDVFNKFIDKEGRFKSSLSKDIKGMLCLYEASQLNEGTYLLSKANEFSRKHLTSYMRYSEGDLERFIRHTLEHPSHLSLQRFKAGHYLSHCQTTYGLDGFLQGIARLDFNIIQYLHEREFKEISSWWNKLGFTQELSLIRDQPLKWYIWAMTILPDPQFSRIRIDLVKVITLIYIMDDIFDLYGSFDELYLFTQAINKWELSMVDQLPRYMRKCYVELYNITNEIAQTVLKKNGWYPIDSLKKMWMMLCNAFLQESKWFASGCVPTTDEYLRNGIISSGAHVLLGHVYFLLGEGITNENVHYIENNQSLISCPATILRLWDDLGSAEDENQDGTDGSYVECYMKEHPHCSQQATRDHVMNLISNTWERLNKECFSPNTFSRYLVEASLNSARMVKVMYSYDDKHLPILEEYINLLLFKIM